MIRAVGFAFLIWQRMWMPIAMPITRRPCASPFPRVCTALVAAVALCCLAAVQGSTITTVVIAPMTQVAIVAIHPHDDSAFTEGLFFLDGALIESTGLAHRSFIREYRLTTGNDTAQPRDGSANANTNVNTDSTLALRHEVLNEFQFDPEIFGEGVACIGNKIYALTYKKNEMLVLSRESFELESTHEFHTTTGEGWGMTTDGHQLIVSDGSSTLLFVDPTQAFKIVRTIEVTLHGDSVRGVNELEYVNGEILANVWFKNEILRIDPEDGRVIEVIDLAWMTAMVANIDQIKDQHLRHEAVMNGIAFDPDSRHVFLTGKLWDSIFEVEFSFL